MSFVPVTAPPPAPSPRASELGHRLSATIDHFRQEHPTLTSKESRQAIMIAMRGTGAESTGIAGAVAMALLIFGAVTFLYFTRTGLDFGGQPLVLMAVASSGVVALAILAAALRKRR